MDEDNNPFAGSGVWAGSWEDTSTAFGGMNSVYGYTPASVPPSLESSSVLAPELAPQESFPSQLRHEEAEHHTENLSDDDTEDGDSDTVDINTVVSHIGSVKESQYKEHIAIVDYGSIRDHGQTAVAYTIDYANTLVMRRYSDFDSLRKALVRLFPTVVIPPIPEKHSVVKYLVNPLNAKNDLRIIEKRTRMLSVFLQRCLELPQVREHYIWRKFLDPTADWAEVMRTPPISVIPQSNLHAPPLEPTKPSPLHLLLPIPHATSINNFKPREEDKVTDQEFRDYEHIFKMYRAHTQTMEKSIKRQKRHFKGLVKDLGELGAYYNAFSLENTYEMSNGIEKTGQAIDSAFLNSEALAFKILTTLQEPVSDISRTSNVALSVLHFRKLKEVQLFIIDTTIKRRRQRIDALKSAQAQAERLSQVLRRNAEQSPTIADAVRRLDKGEGVQKVSNPWARLFNAGSSATSTDDTSLMNDAEREEEVAKLMTELDKLDDCHKVILKDIELVNKAVKENCGELIAYFQSKWKTLMEDYTESLLIWLRENLNAWEEAKKEVDEMEVPVMPLPR